MRYLIDTNIFIYIQTDPDILDKDVTFILQDPETVLYMSVESVKELIVNFNNKKFLTKYWKDASEMIECIENECFIHIVPMQEGDMRTYASLTIEEGHKDPSDHVIISQAITRNLPLISSDKRFPFYIPQGLKLIQA